MVPAQHPTAGLDRRPWCRSDCRSRQHAAVAFVAFAVCCAMFASVGCAKVGTAGGGTGASSGSGGSFGFGSGGSGNQTGSGGILGNDGGLINSDVGTTVCQEGMYKYEPKIATVFLVVDQSGSMFKCRTGGAMDATGRECANHADTSWYPLRDGVLAVLKSVPDPANPTQMLDATVRFGFAAFTGEMADPICPVLKPVLPALNNSSAIESNYNALLPPMKGETPTRKALEQVAALLRADSAPGQKFILFVTDGEPDYCDDGNALCPPDSVVGELQTLQVAGIRTLVMGISSPLTTISDGVLQAFANAGAGQAVLPPFPPGQTLDLNAFYDQCNSVAGWKADFATTGKPAVRAATPAGPFPTIGDYAAAGGTATVYKPDVTNQQALVNEISRALAVTKSCIFDLNDVGGKALKVDPTMLDKVGVKIMGTTVPLDSAGTNGWHLNAASELELVGTACDSWKMPQNTNIDIQIPCSVIIIQ